MTNRWVVVTALSLFAVMTPSHAWPQAGLVRSVRIHQVPGAPAGDFWDAVISNLFRLRSLDEIYPDISVCIASGLAARTCTDICRNAQLQPDDPARATLCQFPLGSAGLPVDPFDRRLRVEVLENDPGQRLIADLFVADPARCLADQPCEVETPTGILSLSFVTEFPEPIAPPRKSGDTGSPSGSESDGDGPVSGLRSALGTLAEAPARLWNAATDALCSRDWTWFCGWRPFVQGQGDRYPETATSANQPCCVHPNDVMQGWHNNCFLLSPIAAIAAVSPGTIKNAIRDDGNGRYTVTFAGANRQVSVAIDSAVVEVPLWKRYDVTTPSWNPYGWTWIQKQRYEHAQPADGDSEVWPILLEHAYGQAFGREGFSGGGDSGTVFANFLGGPGTNILLMPNTPAGFRPTTAFSAQFQEAVTSKAGLRATLLDLERRHKLRQIVITAGSLPFCDIASQDPNAVEWSTNWVPGNLFRCMKRGQNALFTPTGGQPYGKVVPGHAYFFKQYDDTTQTVFLGNPFGGVDLALSLDEFGAGFRHIGYHGITAIADCRCS